MLDSFQKFFNSLTYASPIHWDGITILPFKSVSDSFTDYISLTEAIKKETFVCKEIDDNGRVPFIKSINKTKSNVLFVEGEQIVGGKQNRIINITFLMKKNSIVSIPVSCVEEGRWSTRYEKFCDSENFAFKDLRKNVRASVKGSYLAKKSFESDQSLVRDTVHQKASAKMAFSPTGAMEDIFRIVKPKVAFDTKKLKINSDIQGIVVFKNKKVENIEFISKSKSFAEFYQKYINSLLLSYEDLDKKIEADYVDLANKFWKKLSKINLQSVETIGIGELYSSKIFNYDISMLTKDQNIVYLSIL